MEKPCGKLQCKKYMIRSTAVFDGVSDVPYPAAILVEDDRIRRMLPWDYVHAGSSSAECFSDTIEDIFSGNHLSDESPDAELADLPLYDYGDRLILPSFLDAHTHLFSAAAVASDFVCDTLGEGKSREECVSILKDFADHHPGQKRIRGTGWYTNNWSDKTLPDKRILDEAFPDRPVYLQCADCHSFWLNTRALEEAQIASLPEPEGGQFCRWENGELTGLLLEPEACAPATEKLMEFSDEEMREILTDYQRVLAENGVAAVSEMFAEDYSEETRHKYQILKQLDEEGKLVCNTYIYTELFGHTDFTDYFDMKEVVDSVHVAINGVKGFVDGVTETHTGMLLEPYENRPETCGEGVPLWPRERMEEEILAANRAGIQVRLHCIADGSVRMALNMYEKVQRAIGKDDQRNTIEHIENIHPDDIERFRELKVIPSMQPYHLTLSNNEKILQIGKGRCKYEWPVRSLLAAGGKMAFGSDTPVVTVNPFYTIYAAVTRKNDEGVQFSQNPWETVDMAAALKCYTSGAAYAYGKEREMGSLEAGKKANLIVLDRNLFEIPEEEIEETKVAVNYFEGQLVYEKAE